MPRWSRLVCAVFLCSIPVCLRLPHAELPPPPHIPPASPPFPHSPSPPPVDYLPSWCVSILKPPASLPLPINTLRNSAQSRGFRAYVVPVVKRSGWLRIVRALFTRGFWSASLTTDPGAGRDGTGPAGREQWKRRRRERVPVRVGVGWPFFTSGPGAGCGARGVEVGRRDI